MLTVRTNNRSVNHITGMNVCRLNFFSADGIGQWNYLLSVVRYTLATERINMGQSTMYQTKKTHTNAQILKRQAFIRLLSTNKKLKALTDILLTSFNV